MIAWHHDTMTETMTPWLCDTCWPRLVPDDYYRFWILRSDTSWRWWWRMMIMMMRWWWWWMTVMMMMMMIMMVMVVTHISDRVECGWMGTLPSHTWHVAVSRTKGVSIRITVLTLSHTDSCQIIWKKPVIINCRSIYTPPSYLGLLLLLLFYYTLLLVGDVAQRDNNIT